MPRLTDIASLEELLNTGSIELKDSEQEDIKLHLKEYYQTEDLLPSHLFDLACDPERIEQFGTKVIII